MRIAIGQIAHETNTFCQGETEVEDFQDLGWDRGDDVVRRHRGVRSELGGMLAAAERRGIEVVPTFSTAAEPSGTISANAYSRMLDELLGGIRSALPIDAVCLSLHGAGVAAGVDDLEGDILRHVRELVGQDVPIVVTLDLHGNITPAMAELADLLLGVNFYPHVDGYERGIEAVERAVQIRNEEIRPVAHLALLPMMISASTTDLSPARDINAACWAQEKQAGVLDCTFFHGFPHTDIPRVGVSVYAAADGDPALAMEAAAAVARQLWDTRDTFLLEPIPPATAIRRALAVEGRPVVINEKADNPGGGAPGDGTHLLRVMLESNLTDACFGFVADPETARQAHEAGTGATIPIRLGGKTDDLHGTPIESEAYVKCLTDGRFNLQTPMGQGMPVDLGPCARLLIGGVDVIVSTVRTQTLDPEVFLLHGIDVTRYKIVALKSSAHFRAGFAPVAAEMIRCDTPGLVSADLTTFPYRRLQRPIWPLHRDVEPPVLSGGRGGGARGSNTQRVPGAEHGRSVQR
jgi:microcystin degradation protein MlrC